MLRTFFKGDSLSSSIVSRFFQAFRHNLNAQRLPNYIDLLQALRAVDMICFSSNLASIHPCYTYHL